MSFRFVKFTKHTFDCSKEEYQEQLKAFYPKNKSVVNIET